MGGAWARVRVACLESLSILISVLRGPTRLVGKSRLEDPLTQVRLAKALGKRMVGAPQISAKALSIVCEGGDGRAIKDCQRKLRLRGKLVQEVQTVFD